MTSTLQHLTHLETVGLIKLAQTHPELEFMFRHALVQEVAYNSLLIEDRKKLHLQIGEVIEQTYPDRLEEFAAVLGNHFEVAGDEQRALKYFTLAGDTDFGIYANAEAVSHYTRALKIARKSNINSEEMIYLYTSLGRALELNSQFDEALSTYQEMGALANERNDQSMGLAALMARSTLYVNFTPLHNPDQGETLLEQALTMAQNLGDQAAEAKIFWNLLNLHSFTNRVPQAIDYGERSLALARQLNLHEQIAYTFSDMAYCFLITGGFDRVKVLLREACDLWRKLDNLPMLTDSLSTFTIVGVFAGEYDQAIAFSDEAYQISQSISNVWGQAYSRQHIGYAYWERGQPDQAIAVMDDSIRMSKLCGLIVPQVLARADLAAVYGDLGAIRRGLETAHLSLTIAESQLPVFRIRVLTVLAQLHLLHGNLVEAKAAIDQAKQDPNREAASFFFVFVHLADSELSLKQGDYKRVLEITGELLDTLRLFGARALIPKALYVQGQALLGLGQDDTARDHLLEARTAAEASNARRSLWPILISLSQLETDSLEASRLRQQALAIVEYIVDHTPPELRASFLALPDVQAVFND